MTSSLDRNLAKLQEAVPVHSLVWQPMETFYRMHSFGPCKIIGNGEGKIVPERLALLSRWKENNDIPFLLSAYDISQGLGICNLYLEAFLESSGQQSVPAYKTVITFDKLGALRLDRKDHMLGNSPRYFQPTIISDQFVPFLAHLPAFQAELREYITDIAESR